MDPLEKIIRPIVEGQIRGFLKEHPAIVEAVDWYKPRQDRAQTFINSLAKRIVRDLVCESSRTRMVAALCGTLTATPSFPHRGLMTAADAACLELAAGQAVAVECPCDREARVDPACASAGMCARGED